MVMVKIVFARPKKFDGNANLFGNSRGFEHVIVGEAPSEAAAGAAKMNGNVAGRNFEYVRHSLPASLGRLARRPKLKLAVRKMREAILRLKRRMCDERIGVGGFDNFRSGP